jgi:hypothetical protein
MIQVLGDQHVHQESYGRDALVDDGKRSAIPSALISES